jgi:hypothetical protein
MLSLTLAEATLPTTKQCSSAKVCLHLEYPYRFDDYSFYVPIDQES